MPLTADMACGHPIYRDGRGQCICPKCLPPGLRDIFPPAALGPDDARSRPLPSTSEDTP